ncbi:MAG TPA: ABC transporter permease [Bacteroidales bacterium]|nr:ABC transporter permease [Bacteroidales bacterium]
MFRNYLLVTFRNLFKNRIFTIINILGLGIALSVCIVAFFNHMFNYEFDRNNENFETIYRVNSFRDMQGREQEYGSVPATLALQMKADIPGIKRIARIARSGSPVKQGDEVFPTQISYVDPEFLDIFTFKLLYGEKESISSQGNVIVSQEMAKRLFGNEFPMGKMISIVNDKNQEFTYTITGVFEDLPENNSFRIDVLTHFDNFMHMWELNDADWKFMTTALFIQVQDKSMLSKIAGSLKSYTEVQNRAREDFKINRWVLVPLKDVGSNSRTTWNSGLYPSLHPAAVVSPPIMALFILLIACFNFANTSISTFSKRLKEIGLRKTFGGQRGQLVTQFMFETVIICFLALIVGIALAQWLVPAYSSLWSYMSIELTFTKYPFFWIFLILLLGLTGFLAGVYPALYVSRFSPVSVIRGASGFKGTGRLSSLLLTLQFTISVMALVLGIIFTSNARFQKTIDRGYDNASLIVMPLPPENYSSFRNEVLSNPKVISAEGTQNHIEWGASRKPVKDEEKQLEVDFMDVGPGYPATMGVKLVEGRLFDEVRAGADRTNNSVIVNRMLVDGFGWKQPIGSTFTLNDTIKYNVIGVVEDYYTSGMWEKIEPTVLRLTQTDRYYVMAVRGRKEDLPSILEFMKMRWKAQGTNYVFGGRLQEELMQEERDINGSIMKVNIFLAIVATLLSLIGMYNMVSLDVIKRTKEIGIRKVQGAPVPVLMYIISRKFLIVLLIASLVGSAGGYFLSYSLMDSIWDYFVAIKAGMLILAITILASATILTIIFRIAAAAMRNPVTSLKYE